MIFNIDNPFQKEIAKGNYKVLNKGSIPFPMVPNNKKFKVDVRFYLGLNNLLGDSM